MPDHDHFMSLAIEQARIGEAQGEQPFGALVVRGDEIVVKTFSQKVNTSDTTAHSETLAIKMATQKLGRREIPECTFYATCEPCPMCLGAVLNAGIKTLVLGARYRDLQRKAKTAFNFKNYSVESFADMVGWDLTLINGVRTEECNALYLGASVELTR